MRREISIIVSGRTVLVFLFPERRAKFLQMSSDFYCISTKILVMCACVSTRCQITLVLLKRRIFNKAMNGVFYSQMEMVRYPYQKFYFTRIITPPIALKRVSKEMKNETSILNKKPPTEACGPWSAYSLCNLGIDSPM